MVKHLLKKACESMIMGASYMLGSWVVKTTLETTKKEISNKQLKNEEADPV